MSAPAIAVRLSLLANCPNAAAASFGNRRTIASAFCVKYSLLMAPRGTLPPILRIWSRTCTGRPVFRRARRAKRDGVWVSAVP